MKKKILRVMSLILTCLLLFSVCGCARDAIDEEVFYEYVYEEGYGNTSGLESQYENTNSSVNSNLSSNGTTSSNLNNSSGGQSMTSNTSSKLGGSSNTASQGSNSSTNVTVPFTHEEYLHKSVTISLANSTANSYGFTWNSIGKPISPVLKICKGSTFNEANAKSYTVTYKQYESYFTEDVSSYYFISKAIVNGLSPNTEYSYQICDKGANVFSEPATFKTSNPQADSFTFLHFADSQVDSNDAIGLNTGVAFSNTLAAATANCSSPAFMLHTGDIVEWSKYENYWTNMLDFNKKFFSKYIFAPISGNHETSYRNGSYEIEKHFNITPAGQANAKGFYYYFDYGNTRFIMLNTNDLSSKKLKNDQLYWLKQLLQNNPKKWTVVAMHNPIYSPGKYGSSSNYNSICLALRSQLSSLFAQYKVDLVLQGHDHVYSRTHPIDQSGTPLSTSATQAINGVTYYTNPNGTIYAMHGTSGSQTRGTVSGYTKAHYAFTKTSKESSWAEISADSSKLTVKVYYASNGSAVLVDNYGITK